MKILHDDHFIYLYDVPTKDKSLMELFHNAVWSKAKQRWRLPKSHWVCSDLWETFPELRNDSEFIQLGIRCKEEFDRLIQIRKVQTEPFDGLRPYQAEDVAILEQLEAGGIFNEPRTGKTPTSIVLMKRIGGAKNLVVSPASLVPSWIREIEKWWPEATVCDYKTQHRDFIYSKDPAVLVISKNMLAREKGNFDNVSFDTMIVDEAHFLRNVNTTQSKAVNQVGRSARRRYILTGTPTINHTADAVPLLQFLYPKKYPSYWQTVERYFQTYEADYKRSPEIGFPKPRREKEFQAIVGSISVQRKRSEVMSWLPKKQFKELSCQMVGKQAKLYKQMRNEFMASDLQIPKIMDGDLNKIAAMLESEYVVHAQNFIVQLMRLRQLTIDPRLVGFDVAGAKTKTILDYLENRREPIVIMSMFTSYLKLLAEDMKKLKLKVGFVHGQMSNADKDEAVKLFQAGKIDVLLCNILSAGVGFTMDKSNAVLFCDRAWTPAENEQAEDRVCPTSEEKNHSHIILDVVCEGSIDQRISKILSKKKSLTDIINEGGQKVIEDLLT